MNIRVTKTLLLQLIQLGATKKWIFILQVELPLALALLEKVILKTVGNKNKHRDKQTDKLINKKVTYHKIKHTQAHLLKHKTHVSMMIKPIK